MENVMKLRIRAGISQSELAKRVNVTKTTIVNIESPKCHSLSPKTEAKLMSFFKVSKFDLYGKDNIRNWPESKDQAEKLVEEIKKGI